MNKKGFTLIELMVVIIIIAVVATVGMAGVSGITSSIKKNLWSKKVTLIEESARNYGEDNTMLLVGSCPQIGKTSGCLDIPVETLISNGYITTKERDKNNKKVITNDTKEENEKGYYVNNTRVYIYKENNIVYAKLAE